ncbi:hypothetical protein [Escherichia coli]|uniref:hypothetical protein n=1 Tax=Escherichia coli TaxID=562 RepID=UPI001FCE94A6|nr:hypothetical protein [Escherichia coli]
MEIFWTMLASQDRKRIREYIAEQNLMTVRRLCKALFGRTGSQWLVVEVFGEKGRQHRSADSNPEMVEKMAARYRHAAELHWSATLAEIERVKRLYQTKIKKSKKEVG